VRDQVRGGAADRDYALTVDTVRRWLALEWAVYGVRIRVTLVLLVIFGLLVAFQLGEALLPHHVQNTILKYEEKSNGSREYFGRGVREVPAK
jgi:hypothetical protein